LRHASPAGDSSPERAPAVGGETGSPRLRVPVCRVAALLWTIEHDVGDGAAWQRHIIPRMTIEQLGASPLAAGPLELVAGVIHPLTPSGGGHGIIAARLVVALGRYVLPRALGEVFTAEVGFVLGRGPDTLRVPDVAYIAAGRLPAAGVSSRYMTIAPDIVAEVLSTAESRRTIRDKVAEYLSAGVRLIWLLDPQTRTVTVQRRGEQRRLSVSDMLDGEEVVPGFVCRFSALFPSTVLSDP